MFSQTPFQFNSTPTSGQTLFPFGTTNNVPQQAQPSIFGQSQTQPQAQPNIFGHLQPQPLPQGGSAFGQQPFNSGFPSTSCFNQQQPQTQQAQTYFGQQPTLFSIPANPSPSPFTFQTIGNANTAPQVAPPTASPFGQLFNNASSISTSQPQQVLWNTNTNPTFLNASPTVPLNQNQVNQHPLQYVWNPQQHQFPLQNAPYNTAQPMLFVVPQQAPYYQGIPQASNAGFAPIISFSPQDNFDWGNTGKLPMEALKSSMLGQKPSIFSTDPEIRSPLYNWKYNRVSYKPYAESINSSVASSLVDPPGIRTLPSALFSEHLPFPSLTTEFPKEEYSRFWQRSAEKSRENYKTRQMNDHSRCLERYRKYLMAYEKNPYDGEKEKLSDIRILPRASENCKALDYGLVKAIEQTQFPRVRNATFRNPTDSFHDNYEQYVKRNITRNLRAPLKPLGLFNQPFKNRPAFTRNMGWEGPPKSNDREFNIQKEPPFVKEYKRLEQKVKDSQIGAQLPKLILRNRESTHCNQQYSSNVTEELLHKYASSACTNNKSSSSKNKCGVTLNRPNYYCIPDIPTLDLMVSPNGKCLVEDFEVGHTNYGTVLFPGMTDVKGLNIDDIVTFNHKEFRLYPNGGTPTYGHELNRRAIVTLCQNWPKDKATGHFITDPQRINYMRYENILRRSCERFGGHFLEYDASAGTWTFEFLGINDADEE